MSIQCGEKGSECKIISDVNNQFLYFDHDHFTVQGAKEFGHQLKIKHPHLFH